MDSPGFVGKATADKANVARIKMEKNVGSCILHKLVQRKTLSILLGRKVASLGL